MNDLLATVDDVVDVAVAATVVALAVALAVAAVAAVVATEEDWNDSKICTKGLGRCLDPSPERRPTSRLHSFPARFIVGKALDILP